MGFFVFLNSAEEVSVSVKKKRKDRVEQMQKASEFEKNYTEVTNRQKFKDSKIQGFKDSKIQGFKDSKIQFLISKDYQLSSTDFRLPTSVPIVIGIRPPTSDI
jgi:sensor histidine kinase regulating citrate/malate metabolism